MTDAKPESDLMEKIVSLCKRRGFIYPGSDIYGGFAGTWDFGPFGVELKNNIKQLWWRTFVQEREDMVGLDATILMNPRAWEASGHVSGFADPLVEDLKTKSRYRADHLLEENGIDPRGMTPSMMDEALKAAGIKSPDGNPLSDVRQFNMMFKTEVGSQAGAVSYLRPETAGGIFVNFKNVVDSVHPKLPFGIAQIGKAFRNEIAPRDFIFRLRELEQMEIEYFVRPDDWKESFDEWQRLQLKFAEMIGLDMDHVYQVDIAAEDRAHYSQHSVDTEFDFPFGQKELWGLAYRTDYDLTAHAKASGAALSIIDEEGKPAIVPHVIEPTFGVERTILAALTSAYTEDDLGGEPRVYLKFPKAIAPIKAAVFPLLKNKPELVEKAREVYLMLKKQIPQIMWDDNGNIGKRYRRQDEIGTPVCITVDFDTLGENPDLKDTVTIRNRDTGGQERVAIGDLVSIIAG
jgi:glycyl-tRNA synthetase